MSRENSKRRGGGVYETDFGDTKFGVWRCRDVGGCVWKARSGPPRTRGCLSKVGGIAEGFLTGRWRWLAVGSQMTRGGTVEVCIFARQEVPVAHAIVYSLQPPACPDCAVIKLKDLSVKG